MSTMSTNGNVNAYSGNGRHITAYAVDDGNDPYTTPEISIAHHNKINASSVKRLDSILTGGHTPFTWNTFTKVTNFSQPAGPATHNANTHLLDWLVDPALGLGGSNQVPVAAAGNDITTNGTSVILSGSGNDPDGSISTYAWTKVSGTGGTIASPSSASTSVTGLSVGTYVFRLTVTDNGGATDTDDITVTVTTNQLPTVNISQDVINITLPANSVTLSATGSDPDGTIVSSLWTKIGGQAATIVSPSSGTTQVTNLVEGVYLFRITVTDNNGATAFDEVEVIVNMNGKLKIRGASPKFQ